MSKTKELLPEPTPQELAAMELNKSLQDEQQTYEASQTKMNLPNIFYTYFQKPQKEPKQGEATFAPSYLSNCVRQTYYKKTGEPSSNPIDLPALLKMQFGTVIHNELQRILKEKGILKSFEEFKTAQYHGLTFHYFYDGIIHDGLDLAIIEIKTVYANGFRSVEKEPKPDHVLQCLSYMIFEKLNKAYILYAGRDNGYLLQYGLKLVGNILFVNGKKTDYFNQWEQRIGAMKLLKKAIETKAVPNQEYQIVMKKDNDISFEFTKEKQKFKSDWQCSYCGFKDKCWAKEIAQLKEGENRFYINGKFTN